MLLNFLQSGNNSATVEFSAEREQFGQKIGKFQGVSFKLADMAMEMKAAELLTWEAGWKYDQGTCTFKSTEAWA